MTQVNAKPLLTPYGLMLVRFANLADKLMLTFYRMVCKALFGGVCIAFGLLLPFLAITQANPDSAEVWGLVWILGEVQFIGGMILVLDRHWRRDFPPASFVITILGAIAFAFGVNHVPFTYVAAIALITVLMGIVGIGIYQFEMILMRLLEPTVKRFVERRAKS